MVRGAFKQTTMQEAAFVDWLDRADYFHRMLMREAKLTASAQNAAPVAAPAPRKK
jgi:putative tricarboxylic transport membrane protein